MCIHLELSLSPNLSQQSQHLLRRMPDFSHPSYPQHRTEQATVNKYTHGSKMKQITFVDLQRSYLIWYLEKFLAEKERNVGR
jgi:hypothetical protein